MENKITYPQFRKYFNAQNYFKIISPEALEEVRFIGKKCFVHYLEAKILPERNFIYDLTFDFEKMGEAIKENEYERMRTNCRS